MQRRDFIKGACRICLLGTAVAAAGNSLSSCSPAVGSTILKPKITDNKISVPLSIFEKGNLQIIAPEKYPFEIAIEKKSDGTYSALLLKCTHYDNQLIPTGNGYTCNVHGSRFTKEGAVVKGPAAQALQQLKTFPSSTDLSIQLN